MRIPRITMWFREVLAETEKAYLFAGHDDKQQWMPKSICSLQKVTKDEVAVNVAPFKYQEITGMVPQALDVFSMDRAAANAAHHTVPDHDIEELPGYSLYDRQVDVVIRVKRLRVFALFCEMRVGKTVMAGTIAHSRKLAGLVDRVVVICPKRACAVWHEAMRRSMPVEVIPIERFSNEHTREKLDLRCDERTMVILDESHKIKNPGVVRLDYVLNQTATAGHRCILTGTPIGKHAGDLFFQFAFLDKGILGFDTYAQFSAAHLLYGGREGRKVVAYTNIEEVAAAVSPFVARITREDMGRERPKEKHVVPYTMNDGTRYAELVERHRQHYEENRTSLILKYVTRMQQCASGHVFDEDENLTGYDDNGRIAALRALRVQLTGAVVVFYKYNAEADAIRQAFHCDVLNGDLPQNRFDYYVRQFNMNGGIIAVQQSLAAGFSLKAADHLIYYTTTYDLIARRQSEDRASEDHTRPLHVWDLVATGTIDQRIQDVLNMKTEITRTFKQELAHAEQRTT